MQFTSRSLPDRGAANLGIYEHTLPRQDGVLLRIIEKRVSNNCCTEISICRQLARARNWGSHDSLGPLPLVYGVQRNSKYTSIYMQHYQGCGRKTRSPIVYGALVATSLAQLPATQLAVSGCNASITEVCDALRIICFSRSSVLNRDYISLHSRVAKLAAQLIWSVRDLPVIISHNDLRRDNICITGTKGGRAATFIDLGSMTPNYAGADLRHLLRRSMKSAYWKLAYESARDNYAGAINCSPIRLSASAHIYAMLKWLKVIRNSMQAEMRQDIVEEMYLQGVDLYESAKALRSQL